MAPDDRAAGAFLEQLVAIVQQYVARSRLVVGVREGHGVRQLVGHRRRRPLLREGQAPPAALLEQGPGDVLEDARLLVEGLLHEE